MLRLMLVTWHPVDLLWNNWIRWTIPRRFSSILKSANLHSSWRTCLRWLSDWRKIRSRVTMTSSAKLAPCRNICASRRYSKEASSGESALESNLSKEDDMQMTMSSIPFQKRKSTSESIAPYRGTSSILASLRTICLNTTVSSTWTTTRSIKARSLKVTLSSLTTGVPEGKGKIFSSNGSLLFDGVLHEGLPVQGIFYKLPRIFTGKFIIPNPSNYKFNYKKLDLFIKCLRYDYIMNSFTFDGNSSFIF